MKCWRVVSLAGLLLLTGCSEYGYRYQPHPQVLYSPIFADYREGKNGVDILVDTDGLQLKQVEIVKADGKVIAPTKVDYPKMKAELLRGDQEEIYGPALAQGPTVAHFDKDAIGAKPWNVRVAIQDVPMKMIRVGGQGG